MSIMTFNFDMYYKMAQGLFDLERMYRPLPNWFYEGVNTSAEHFTFDDAARAVEKARKENLRAYSERYAVDSPKGDLSYVYSEEHKIDEYVLAYYIKRITYNMEQGVEWLSAVYHFIIHEINAREEFNISSLCNLASYIFAYLPSALKRSKVPGVRERVKHLFLEEIMKYQIEDIRKSYYKENYSPWENFMNIPLNSPFDDYYLLIIFMHLRERVPHNEFINIICEELAYWLYIEPAADKVGV